MSNPRIHLNEIERIGLNPAAGWYVAAGIFFLTGVNMWIGGLLGIDELAEPLMRFVASFGVIGSPIWYFCARRNVAERWLHIPIFLGTINILCMALVLGPQRGAFAILFMSALLPPAYLHGLRFAAPHFVFGSICVTLTIIISDEPFGALRAPVAVATILLLLIMLSLAHEALARVVAVNRQLAEVDPLTGVANVRTLQARLQDDIERADRRGGRVALYAIDLDNFKEVNDTYGHTTGDRILREVALAMSDCLDPADLLARRGGDEFSVIAPLTIGRDPDALAQRLADAVAYVRRDICPDVLPSASVGFVVREQDESPADLIERGDAALHQKKLIVHPERIDAPLGQTFRRSPSRSMSISSANQEINRFELGGASWAHRKRRDETRAVIGAAGFLIAGMIGIAGAVLSPGEMSGLFAVTIAVAQLACSPVCLWLERSRRWRSGVSIMIGMAILLTTAQIFATGSAGSAFVDFYMGPVVFFFYVAMTRPSWPTSLGPIVFIACMALFAGFLLHTGYPFMSMRLVATVNVLAVAAGLFVLTERQIRRYNARNEELARTDSLTGLANVRQLRTRLDEEIARCKLTGDQFSLFMIDLDDFKQVNDRVSHLAGDHTLEQVARAIEFCVRADELAARRGGDEFAIVTGPAEPHELDALRDRVAAAISQARKSVCGDLLSSASVGLATWRPGENALELIARADASLKEAKEAGRQRRTPVDALQAVSQ